MLIENPFEVLNSLSLISSFMELSEEDWNILKALKNHSDYEVRLYLCEVLANFPCDNSEKLLMDLLNDEDSLVVASACDILSFSDSVQVLDKLKKCTQSFSFIVRGYSHMSIGEILNRKDKKEFDNLFFINSMKNEKSVWVQASIAYALCLNGFSDKYLSNIENLLCNRFYNYRIYALNLFNVLISNKVNINKTRIIKKLILQRKKERNRVVLKKIDNLLDMFNQEENETNQGDQSENQSQSGDG